jgi:hypothetical protein
MFISKTLNKIYLRVPKTGSTSLSRHFVDVLGGDEGSIHTTINVLSVAPKGLSPNINPHSSISMLILRGVITENFALNADVYALIRNPVDRFVSWAYHSGDGKSYFSDKNKNELVEEKLAKIDMSNHMLWPQVTWCTLNGEPINKLFLYEDFTKMAKDFCGKEPPVEYRFRDEDHALENADGLDVSLVQEIEKVYKEDVALHKIMKIRVVK